MVVVHNGMLLAPTLGAPRATVLTRADKADFGP